MSQKTVFVRNIGLATLLLSAASAVLLLGCATSFTGDARVEGGPSGCWDKCRQQDMVMDAFVYFGEYSNACVCAPSTAGQTASRDSSGGAAGASAAAGVVMQMRRSAQQQRR